MAYNVAVVSSVLFDFNESEVRESIKSFRPQLEAAGVISIDKTSYK